MNKQQQIVIWIAAVLLVAMILVPPWVVVTGQNLAYDAGYHLIFEAPQPGYGLPHMNYTQLIIQIAIVVVVACGLVLALKDKPHEKKE